MPFSTFCFTTSFPLNIYIHIGLKYNSIQYFLFDNCPLLQTTFQLNAMPCHSDLSFYSCFAHSNCPECMNQLLILLCIRDYLKGASLPFKLTYNPTHLTDLCLRLMVFDLFVAAFGFSPPDFNRIPQFDESLLIVSHSWTGPFCPGSLTGVC